MERFFHILVLASVILMTDYIGLSSARDLKNLNKEITDSLAALRSLVENDIKESFMLDNYYLIGWLSKKNLNATETAAVFLQYLKFRDEQKLSTILDEDWSDMELKFPYSRKITAKNGGPLIYKDLAQWRTGDFLKGGPSAAKRLLRYFLKINEEEDRQVIQSRTRSLRVTNAGGFSFKQHACNKCVKLYRKFSNLNKPFGPTKSIEMTVVVNAPTSYNQLFSKMRDSSGSIVKVYGQHQNEWQAFLSKRISLSELPICLFAGPTVKNNSNGLMKFRRDL